MLKQILEILKLKLIDTKTIDFTVANLLLLIFVLFVTTIVLKFIRKIVTRKLPLEDSNKFISVFQFIKYVVYVLVFMFTMHSCGVNMSVFLTASAALFVGIGFALQTFFQDLISGILIILDQSLHVGDIIEVDGKVGEVKEIKLRTTRVVTRNDRVMVIPNHKFMIETLFNWTQNNTTNREQVSVGVAYGSDVNLVKRLLIEAARETEGVIEPESITVLFEDFADSSLNFSVYFYVANGMKSPRIQSDIRFKIDESFKINKVAIPFPQRDIRIINQ
ncbi:MULTISPECIES: mechanosensitive ion channel family protein [unclassified Flavobacterium]|uniref:mechanosensitive ion channel family protein n=1 Tax=unclassified Flavobacterium TaxID=196869 RepID=UPI00129173AD|nr:MULTISPECIES: mechanosensitive ion channel domain-containing protein [unclassified Flavobacterium]MQP52602.1 mechanosensitive ion channel [Flavobacterium sp. LMO9]MQP62672.1 mechanosensitive ion channel [Flavobacterium sp. LMO6]